MEPIRVRTRSDCEENAFFTVLKAPPPNSAEQNSVDVYYIPLKTFLSVVCHEHVENMGFLFELDIPLYTIDHITKTFVLNPKTAKANNDLTSTFFIYDQCAKLMLNFLRQTLEHISSIGVDDSRLAFIKSVLFAPKTTYLDYENVLQWLNLVEQCCSKIHDNGAGLSCQKLAIDSDEYITASKWFADLLWEGGALFQTIQKSKHMLARLESVPLLALIFEGHMIVSDPKRFDTIRRPILQQCILINLDRFVGKGDVEDKKQHAEDMANQLLMEEEEEKLLAAKAATVAAKKREKKRKQRERKQLQKCKPTTEDTSTFTFSPLAAEFIPCVQ